MKGIDKMTFLYRPTKFFTEFLWAVGFGLAVVLAAWIFALGLDYADPGALAYVLPWTTLPLVFGAWLCTDLEEGKFQGGITVQFFLTGICGWPIWDNLQDITSVNPTFGTAVFCFWGTLSFLAVIGPWPVRALRIIGEMWRRNRLLV
ncbi:hypothetical protein HY523_02890 [Candidatus Berkelbacteria bacterium]|nr:hypothetical protein [Candidatus Berkelbacteria bacterium]